MNLKGYQNFQNIFKAAANLHNLANQSSTFNSYLHNNLSNNSIDSSSILENKIRPQNLLYQYSKQHGHNIHTHSSNLNQQQQQQSAKRKRRHRTIFSEEQLEQLETTFAKVHFINLNLVC
jgi:hypothetical protein